VIIFRNIKVEAEIEYFVGFRIGFINEIDLPTDINKGFGLVQLLYKD